MDWETTSSRTANRERGHRLRTGLDGMMFNDLMKNIECVFNLHNKNKAYLTKRKC